MKTHEQVMRGFIRCLSPLVQIRCALCPYRGMEKCRNFMIHDVYNHIQQRESTYSQVSKALCGKENAISDEVLQAVDQLKQTLLELKRENDDLRVSMRMSEQHKHDLYDENAELKFRLAQVERERDAAVFDLARVSSCFVCVYFKVSSVKEPCVSCLSPRCGENYFQWRGVCAENTKDVSL